MIKTADKVPSARWKPMGQGRDPKRLTTGRAFAPGKKVVGYALPGALTLLVSAKNTLGAGSWAEAGQVQGEVVSNTNCLESPSTRRLRHGRLGKRISEVGDKVMMLGGTAPAGIHQRPWACRWT